MVSAKDHSYIEQSNVMCVRISGHRPWAANEVSHLNLMCDISCDYMFRVLVVVVQKTRYPIIPIPILLSDSEASKLNAV